jgi:hypothetical protein
MKFYYLSLHPSDAQTMKTVVTSIFCFFFIALSINGYSITPGHSVKEIAAGPGIRLKVIPWENGVPLPGVNIRLSKDSVVIRDFRTFKPDGWNEESAYVYFNLETNSKYTLTLTKKGYVQLVVIIDTHLPSTANLTEAMAAVADITMLKESDHPNLKDADFPLVLLKYNSEKGMFLPSKEYANSIRIMMQMK